MNVLQHTLTRLGHDLVAGRRRLRLAALPTVFHLLPPPDAGTSQHDTQHDTEGTVGDGWPR